MTKSDLLTRKRSEPVEINGETINVRRLTQGEVKIMQDKYEADEARLDGMAFVACRCIVDEQGKRIFDDDDLASMGDLEFDLVKAVFEAVMRFSGFAGDEAGKAESSD